MGSLVPLSLMLICAFLFSGLSGGADAAPTITVAQSGTGTGIVTSSPPVMNCGPNATGAVVCSHTFTGTPVTLIATADAGSSFVRWNGCSSTTSNQCFVSDGVTRTVTVTFSSLNDKTIRIGSVNSSCASVYACVEVKGASGVLNNLVQRDFTVFADSVQKTDFTLQTATCPGASTAVAMTMDYSGSMPEDAITDMENAAVDFITRITSTGGQAEVIKFSSEVEVMQSFTSNASALTSAVLDDWPGAGGATALFDSVYQALVDTASVTTNTRAVVAMTDGGDNGSTRTIDEVIQFAKDNQLPIFTIGLGGADATALTQMAVDTGGKYFEAPTSAELAGIYAAIASDLDVVGYLLTYSETDLRPGRSHTLKIKVADNAAGSQSVQYSTLGCYNLTVNATGEAGGSVLSDVGGIDFAYPATSIMSTILKAGSHVNIFADLAATNSQFTWSGACGGGVTPCQIDMDADNKNVTVAFMAGVPTQQRLTITKTGAGAGTVIPVLEQGDTADQLSNWSINWLPETEMKAYTFYWDLVRDGVTTTVKLYRSSLKSTVDLVAQGSRVGNGTIILGERISSGLSGSVDVTYSADDTDSANAIMGSLFWNGSTATSTHNNGDVVTLTPVTNSGSYFAGWSGDCSGFGLCQVTMNAAKNVTANFDTAAGNYALTVTKTGSGFGTVLVNNVTFANTIPQQFENGDAANQLSGWTLTGVSASNTDDYILYWNLTDSGGGTSTVSLYKSAAKSSVDPLDKVAEGSGPNGSIALVEANGSGINGSVTVNYSVDDTDINNTLYFAVITEFGDETSQQLSEWALTGISSSNTDLYMLYWSLTDSGGTRTVSLYKAAAKAAGDLVAEGSKLGDGTITLLPQNSSGLSGSVKVALKVALADSGDNSNQLSVWSLSGLSTTNIDSANRSIYWDLLDFDRLGIVNLYRSSTKSLANLVATGFRTGDGPIDLFPQNFSGMSGSLNAAFVPQITEFGDDLTPGQVSNWTLLGISGMAPDAHAFYWKLTDLFGDRTVTLSQFIEAGDPGIGQVGNWQLQGMNPFTSVLYWDLSVTVSGSSCAATVTLYNSVTKTNDDKVAAGTGTCNAKITLSTLNFSGLFGTVEVIADVSDTDLGNTLTLTEVATGSRTGNGTILLGELNASGLTGSVDVLYQGLDDINTGDSVYSGNILVVSFQDSDAENILRISYNDTDSDNLLVLPRAGDFIWIGSIGTATFKANDIATLMPVAASGSEFTVWTGCDSLNGDLCIVAMNADRAVTAEFTRPPSAILTINIAGTGGGTVAASSGLITWNGPLTIGTAPYGYNTPVILTATPSFGAVFTGWSGACRNTGNTCRVLMGSDQEVTAHFLLLNTSSFSDVSPGSYAAPYIETLFNNEFNPACAGGNTYCPNEFVNNGQVAVFIIKALGLAPAPACTGAIYNDVNAAMTQGAEVCRYIEAFSELNIVARRSDGYFLPNAYISRGEMAVVLLKALGVLPADLCTATKFDDVNGSIFGGNNTCRYIEKLWEFSVAVGCGGDNFCPDNSLTRADMSLFLAETFLQPNISCRTMPVKDTRTSLVYSTVQNAFADVVDVQNGDILRMVSLTSAESVNLNRPGTFTLRGGYDCAFISNFSNSAIEGSLTITNGTLIIDGIVIK
ncbi:MAG: VWA domain-containing protein [Nitrospirae bacterium]|nr:VWA domain-containing protein [Nitrospirota bacterium]